MTQSYVVLLRNREIRAAAVIYTDPVLDRVGHHYRMLMIENSHDQTMSCKVQGRLRGGTAWIDIAEVPNTVLVPAVGATNGVGYLALEYTYGELRVEITPGGVPTTGDITMHLYQ